ncbi:hypothetical protein BV25DRAFT_1866421, partial [Artomyces pyxidatus]
MSNTRRRRGAAELDEDPNKMYERLYSHEVEWVKQQPYLESKGYMLRPRLRPGWIPSWRTNGKDPEYCEDAHVLPFRNVLVDATRISDGKLVYIKRVKTGDQELAIALFLQAGSLRDDPRNHSVPILDVFPDLNHEGHSYIVMPFLQLMDRPEFTSIGEIVDFADQILEGLVFLHEHGVAHRDCSRKNLMMDAGALYPLGVHPVADQFLPDGVTPLRNKVLTRSAVGVKYYFVDYGISSHILANQDKLVVGMDGRDREVPELSSTVPYDPFKVDIFTIGNVFRREFHDNYSNVEFFAPIIESMVRLDPARRPTAAEALEQWQTIRRGVSALHRSWRPKPSQETRFVAAVLDFFN